MAITYAFLSGNARKSHEYREQLSKYGRSICLLPYEEDEEKRNASIRSYLAGADKKDAFVLRETSDLYVAGDWEKGVQTVSGKSAQGERVYHVSFLTVYSLSDADQLQTKRYQAQVEGHIDLTRRGSESEAGWWDDIFVPDRSNTSYRIERDLWGKASARQQTIGLFICDHLIFKRLRDVNFRPHAPREAVDFANDQAAGAIMRDNPFIQMARLEQCPWGLGNLLTNAINGGIYFRSADSRRSGNYFSPPIGGIPRTKKPDPFWETTFQIHDFFHQVIPDQMFTGTTSRAHEYVYVAARLMSEGFTIVLADMLYVEAVKASGFQYDYSTRKINPLFGSLTLPQGTRKEQLKALLKANVRFANLGDLAPYRSMLKSGCDDALSAYTDTYKNFFVPDLLWSADNYRDMVKRKREFEAWVKLVGVDLFARAGLPLLDDTMAALKADGADFSSYEAVVPYVFEHIFNRMVAPSLAPVDAVSDEVSHSRAFLRYSIGQMFLYARYRKAPGMRERGKRMVAKLRSQEVFGSSDIERIRKLYRDDLVWLSQSSLLSGDDVALYSQIFPIFSPSFLSYDFDNTPYATVPEAIKATFGG